VTELRIPFRSLPFLIYTSGRCKRFLLAGPSTRRSRLSPHPKFRCCWEGTLVRVELGFSAQPAITCPLAPCPGETLLHLSDGETSQSLNRYSSHSRWEGIFPLSSHTLHPLSWVLLGLCLRLRLARVALKKLPCAPCRCVSWSRKRQLDRFSPPITLRSEMFTVIVLRFNAHDFISALPLSVFSTSENLSHIFGFLITYRR